MEEEGWKNVGEEWGGLRKRGREGNGEGGGGGVEECWRGMGRVA